MWRTSDIREAFKPKPKKFEPEQIKPFIDSNIVQRIDSLEEFDISSIHNGNFWDDANTSELARIFENASERDILTVCYVAVRKFPTKYLTVLMDYILEKEGK